MLDWLRARRLRSTVASNLYGSIVTAARRPFLYTELGVPDTVEGRYEMIVLHLVAVLERLRREGENGEELSRLVIETFVTDIDDSIREMGVGDLSVPRKVTRAAVGLYERAEACRAAIEASDRDALAVQLATRIGFTRVDGPRALAAVVLDLHRQLSVVPGGALLAGRLPLADRTTEAPT